MAKFNLELCQQWSLKNVVLKLPHCDTDASINQGVDHVDLIQSGTLYPFDKLISKHTIFNIQMTKMAQNPAFT